MKLILCPKCDQVVSLRTQITTCECGSSWGWYKDNLNAVYGGESIPLGFDNFSLINAVNHQPENGMGHRFEAFVIPKECPTFRKE